MTFANHLVMGNRILPANWGEVRDHKGIKFHKKCWWAVAAFFGFAISWNLSKHTKIYFVTESAKNWWKSNARWRQEHGFHGEFTKKKFLSLLNTKIQARTTTEGIQKAAEKPAQATTILPIQSQATLTPAQVVELSTPVKTIEVKKIRPLTDREKLEVICDECRQLIKRHLDESLENEDGAALALSLLEQYINSHHKGWVGLEDTAEYKQFLATAPTLKSKIESQIRDLRRKEIERIKKEIENDLIEEHPHTPTEREVYAPLLQSSDITTHAQFIKDHNLTLPTYSDFDSETAKLMQYRWLLQIKAPEIAGQKYSKLVRQNTLDEAIARATEDGDDGRAQNLQALKEWLSEHPEVEKIDLTTVKVTINEKIKMLQQFRHKYELFFTPNFNESFLNRLHGLIGIKDDYSFKEEHGVHENYDLVQLLDDIGPYVPAELENIRTKAYLAEFKLDTTFKDFAEELLDEFLRPFDVNGLPPETTAKLKECRDALVWADKDPKAIFDVLQKNFPDKFVKYEAANANEDPILLQKLEFAKILKQVREETVNATTAELVQMAKACILKCQTHFAFDPANFQEAFPKALDAYHDLGEEIEHLRNAYLLPEDLKKDLKISDIVTDGYEKYEILLNHINAAEKALPKMEALQEALRAPIAQYIADVDKVLAHAPQQLGQFKAKLQDVQKFAEGTMSLENLVTSLKELKGKLPYREAAFTPGPFAAQSPEWQFMERYNYMDAMKLLSEIANKEDYRIGKINEMLDEQNGILAKELTQAIEHATKDKDKLEACVNAMRSDDPRLFQTLDKTFPGKFAPWPEVMDGTSRQIQAQKWINTLLELAKQT